jgi:ribosomal protein S16
VTTKVAVKIRLKRFGKMRAPYYRIVVADSRTKRDGRAIEEIGKYHPTEEPSFIEVNSERAQYWLSVGALSAESSLRNDFGDEPTPRPRRGLAAVPKGRTPPGAALRHLLR